MADTTNQRNSCRASSCKPRWKPTSSSHLEEAEKKILSCLSSDYELKYVTLPNSKHRIRTITVNPGKRESTTPLVMVHGFAGGLALWVQNLDDLAKDRTVYAFDLLGFGRSSRPKFGSTPQEAESQFVDSIEEWRQEMGLEKFILLGHSLGGYLSTSYTIQYHDRVKHLILADPWGFPEPEKREIPRRYKVIATIIKPFNPLMILRVAGPWGPGLVNRFRGDLREKFSHLFDDNAINEYIYHCNVRRPSGESGFKSMSGKLAQAKLPMIQRVSEIPKELPMTIVYGESSWMKKDAGYDVKDIRNGSQVDVKMVEEAGHHVYADQAFVFNNIANRVCRNVDRLMKRSDSSNNQNKTTSINIQPTVQVEVH